MRPAMVVMPYEPPYLQVAKQIGVDDIVYYDMKTMPFGDDLTAEVEKLRRLGLRLTVVECGPPIDRIVMGKDGRDRQIERFQRSLDEMGRAGVEVLCYTFMPQVMDDNMVVRTSYDVPARGGAVTSAFRLAEVTSDTVPHSETPLPPEAMWDNLEYFLRRLVPAAEAAGVKLAMHPDDPPITPICGLHRIMSSLESFDRLLSISSSPVNGIAYCFGCFGEMGVDPVEAARRFGSRIAYVHFRDVAGVPADFVETFPDDGPTDFLRAFRAFHEAGVTGPVRVDHVPRLAIEDGRADEGYGLLGHVFATGYLTGLLEAVRGKPSAGWWQRIPSEMRRSEYTAAVGESMGSTGPG